jgi:nucleotide-binding universal stress UspA family protein
MRGWLLETVTIRLMRQVEFIPQSHPAHTIRSIAHPVNFSNVSVKGLNWAIHLAQDYQAELLLLYVVPPPTPLFELESPMKSEAELALSVLLAKLQTAAIKARGFLLTGTSSIDSQIVRAARLERVDVIIMATGGRNGISGLLTRSLPSRVVAHAHCPVLVVPNDDRRRSHHPKPSLNIWPRK